MPDLDKDIGELLEHWRAGYRAQAPEVLAELYTDNVQFLGSTPALRQGRAAVQDYFTTLPFKPGRRVEFQDRQIARLTDEVAVLAALAVFESDGAPPVRKRLTLTFLRTAGGWKIATHHVSDAG